ncbi:Dot/Icm T4SS effector Zinc-dependent metalloprotease LegP [Bradyrhizobium sp.]|uniref:Dot/Icm T4SS effector Zinc-dependent metalloprotease LegP n=1 Tax=Bradyrhizobium sp. TaxID=376 RepID=UPI002CF186FD|nr:Dot/Icm T4SS effector Zinc-dependent metalloprotease LegP [Bradyrhizobium sp.]HMM87570.1 M12 family metallopeptidase [Bradyrhizobium sp.]
MANGFLESDTTDTTWIKPLGSEWKEVTYAAVDGLAVFEGCIILGTVEEAQNTKKLVADNPGALQDGTQLLGAGIKGVQFRWKNDTIPFEIDPALPNQQRVLDAIKHWQDNTPIKFVKRNAADPAHRDFVVFRPGNGCASSVGRRGGRQDVILGGACSTGNCIHEIGHTVGLWHEQSRKDRNQFVTIKLNLVDQNARHNFDQHIQDGVDLGAYDYGSIMHYPRDAFSSTGEDTIIPKQAGVEIGQRKKLSDGDIKSVKKLITI